MQCPVCGFENMPDQNKCVRCSTQLKLTGSVPREDLSPPRSKRIKFLQPFLYATNRLLSRLPEGVFERIGSFFSGVRIFPGDAIAAMILSIIPGFGHLVEGKLRNAIIIFTVWLLSLILIINHYTGTIGGLLFGFSLSWHAAIVFHAGRVQMYAKTLKARLYVMLSILICLSSAYFSINSLVHRHVGFMVCSFNIEALGLRKGDTLLVRKKLFSLADLSQGDVVSAGISISPDDGTYWIRIRGPVVGQIMALPGDTIQTSGEGLLVNSTLARYSDLPKGNLPIPENTLSLIVPEGHIYFIFPTENSLPPGIASRIWTNIFLVKTTNVKGRALGIYLPISRRRFF